MYLVKGKIKDLIGNAITNASIYVSDANGNPTEHNGIPNVSRRSDTKGAFIIPVAFKEDFISIKRDDFKRLTIPADTAVKKTEFLLIKENNELPELTVTDTKPGDRNKDLAATANGIKKRKWIIWGVVALVAVAVGAIVYLKFKK